jgi:hypothetical protein
MTAGVLFGFEAVIDVISAYGSLEKPQEEDWE